MHVYLLNTHTYTHARTHPKDEAATPEKKASELSEDKQSASTAIVSGT